MQREEEEGLHCGINSLQFFQNFVCFFSKPQILYQGQNLQNFLGKFVRFFVTLGLKILRLLRLKVLFEANIIKGQC